MPKTESGKIKFRFNLIDALLIVTIIAAAGILIYIFMSSEVDLFSDGNTVAIEYTVEIKQIRTEFRDLISIEDPVTDTVTQYPIGSVTDVAYSDTQYTGINRGTGELVFSNYPERMNIVVTIHATAEASSDGYIVNGYRVSVGKNIALRVPSFIGEGYCTTITEIDG